MRRSRPALAVLVALASCGPREIEPNEAARAKAAEATVLERDGDWSGALAAWSSARAADPASPFAALEAGRLYARMGLYAEAVAAYADAATRAPRSPRPHLALAALYREAGRSELATRALGEGERVAPRDPDVLIESGRDRLERDNPWKAATELGAALRARPQDAEVYVLLGRLERRRHAYGEAEAALRKGLERDARSLSARLELAGLLREMERSSEALKLLEPELDSRPLPPEVIEEITRLYEKLERPDEAERWRRRLTEVQGEEAALRGPREALWRRGADLDARRALGLHLLRLERGREAEGIYRGWVYYEPATEEAWEGVANACLVSGDAAGARRALERAVTNAGTDAAVLARLAELFRRAGDEARANALAPIATAAPEETPR